MAALANRPMSMDRIVIVGGGPVGMVLSLNLAAFGTRSVLINREPKPRWHPKGSTQNARTMEHYRRLGIVDKIRTLGLPLDLPTDVTYFTSLSGWELARIAKSAFTRLCPACRLSRLPSPFVYRSTSMDPCR